jgi:hypothetical protein
MLLALFVGTYVFLAYWYPDDTAEWDSAADRSQAAEPNRTPPAAGSNG